MPVTIQSSVDAEPPRAKALPGTKRPPGAPAAPPASASGRARRRAPARCASPGNRERRARAEYSAL
jgi:hypothetical protein